jgi:integrase
VKDPLMKQPLSVKKIEKILARRKPGDKAKFYPDGKGLHLTVGGPNAASWNVRYQLRGKRTWISVGVLDAHNIEKDLTRARQACHQLRLEKKDGLDPQQQKQKRLSEAKAAAEKARTFKQCAEEYLERKDKNLAAVTAVHWRQRLKRYVYPLIGDWRIEAVGTAAISKVLDQHVEGKGTRNGKEGRFCDVRPWVAENTRGYIASIIRFAMQKEYRPREGYNPALRENLDEIIPELPESTPNRMLPYPEMPAFVARVREYQRSTWRAGCSRATASGVNAILLIMLTAARIGSTICARWADIDLDKTGGGKNAIWTIPAEEMKYTRGKARKEVEVYRVPLSPQAVELLSTIPQEGRYVFIGQKAGGHISDEPVRGLLERLGYDFTPHGFRRSFSTWGNDDPRGFDHNVIEHCLAHLVGTKVSRIYNTAEQIAKRRRVMNAWGEFAYAPTPVETGIVVKLRQHG